MLIESATLAWASVALIAVGAAAGAAASTAGGDKKPMMPKTDEELIAERRRRLGGAGRRGTRFAGGKQVLGSGGDMGQQGVSVQKPKLLGDTTTG